MKKVAVVTATRAEYGLLSPVIRELRKQENSSFKTDLIVTGTHLSEQYGMTVNEIESEGEQIDYRIPISVDSANEISISRNQAEALRKFTELFVKERYDGVVLLGDRYEILMVAIAASNTRTPIFHLCGGDTTEGAMDEWIRHSITKMSYLHFVTNEDSRRRVIQMGENPKRVFNYGSTSIDNVINVADMSKLEALESIGLSDCKYALCTYHPVTMESNSIESQMSAFFEAIKMFPELSFIITKSNADQGGSQINELLDDAMKHIDNVYVFSSLGVRRYLSLMRCAEFVLGNSSSGIVEAPAFHVPTINIGDRQRGRLRAKSIIDCDADTESICAAITSAMMDNFKKNCQKGESLYGNGNAGILIATKIAETVRSGSVNLKKSFYMI